MQKNSFVLMGNDSPYNRGCEAITLGTARILSRYFPGDVIVDAHYRLGNAPVAKPVSPDSSVLPITFPQRWSWRWILFQLGVRGCEALTQHVLFASLRDEIKSSRAVLSVGGDNYSLDYGLPKRFIAMDRYIHKQGKPLVIWGASIGPFSAIPAFEKIMANHLKNEVDLILVREEASQSYLDAIGVSKNVRLVGDPAFVMEPLICSTERLGFVLPENFIAISTGAMMARYVTAGVHNKWKYLCCGIINKIRSAINLPVVLIPHVEADHIFFEVMKNELQDNNVYLVGNYLSSSEMKWIIGQSDLLIGSRMHATIGGFSTSVPVLSLAYSLKAVGLNRQMFGHEDYLLKGSGITIETVMEKITWMLENNRKITAETEIGAKRQQEMAWRAGAILKSYLDTDKIPE